MLFLAGCGTEVFLSHLVAENFWTFDKADNYNFDTNYVEVTGGKAQLKVVDQLFSGTDFNNGTHVGTYYDSSSSKIKLRTFPDADVIHVNTILPSKSSNLVGYWRMDGNFNDSSNFEHSTSSASSDTSLTDGFIGINGALFDGNNDKLSVIYNSSFDLSQNFTVSAWVKFNTVGNRTILEKTIGGSVNSQYLLFMEGSQFRFRAITPAFTTVTSTTVAQIDQWYHITGVHDGTNVQIYINGALEDSTAAGGAMTGSGELLIGLLGNDNFDMDGTIDEVSIWDNDLSAIEVFNLYEAQNGNFTELSSSWTPHYSNIVGYWKMDGNWQDSSGNGNHASVGLASATFSNDLKVGSQSLLVDSPGRMDTPGLSFSTNENFTASFWYKTTDGSGTLIGAGSTGNSIMAISLDGTRFRVFIRDTDFNLIDLTPSAPFIPTDTINDSWHFLAFTLNRNGSADFYIDGVLLRSIDATAFTGIFDPIDFRVGFNLAASFDDIAIYSAYLSNSDVKLIYDRQKQKYAGHYDSSVIDLGASGSWTDLSAITSLPFGKEIVAQTSESSSDYSSLDGDLSDSLVGYWKMNENSWNDTADEINDESIKSNHGRAKNGAGLSTGVLKSGGSLDGSNDYLLISDSASLDLDAKITVSAWIYPIDTSTFQSILNKEGAFQVLLRGGNFQYSIGNTVPGWSFIDTGVGYGKNWYHIAVSYDSTEGSDNLNFYVNGTMIHQMDASGLLTMNAFDLLIGAKNSSSPASFYNGKIDEVAIWSRDLSATEIQQLYRRGANRVKYQVKSCVDSSCNCTSFNIAPVGSANDCDGDGITNSLDNDDSFRAEFMGPGGNSVTTFSELFNRDAVDMTFNCAANTSDSDATVCVDDEITLAGDSNAGSPTFSFSDFPASARPPDNRYFQYRVLMEAEDNTACSGEACLPELTSVELAPTGRYFSGQPEIVNTVSGSLVRTISSVIVDASAQCNIGYQVSNDGTNFYYWNGTSWVIGLNSSQSNDLTTLNANISSFAEQVGFGSNFFFKSYLGTTNFSPCELNSIQFQ